MQKIFTILLLIFCFGDLLGQQLQQENRARQHLYNNEFEQAAKIYQKLYEQYEKERYYPNLLKSLIGAHNYPVAEKLIRQQLSSGQGNVNYKIDLAELYAQLGRLKESEKLYKSILNSLPDKPYLINKIVTHLYNRGKTKLGIEVLLKSRKQLKDPSLFTFELARLYYLDKQLSRTLEELLDYLERNPKSFDAIKSQLRYYSRSQNDMLLLRKIVDDRMSASSKSALYPKLLTWILIEQNNYAQALEWAIKLNRTQNNEQQILMLAQRCAGNQHYETAENAYRYLLKKGRNKNLTENAKSGLLDTRYQRVISGNSDSSKISELAKELEESIASTTNKTASAEMAFRLALLNAQYLNQTAKAVILLQNLVKQNGLSDIFKAKYKLKLGDFLLINNRLWEAVLLYGQVENAFENDSIGREARFRNARLSYFLGEFDWAKRELDVLKGATSQAMANDALNLSLLIAENQDPDSSALKMYARADLLIFRNKEMAALIVLDSIASTYPKHSLNDDILMSKARIHIQMGKYAEALTLLNKIIDRYAYDIWADDALFTMADLYEHRLNNKTQAQHQYKKLLLDYPGSLYTLEARKRFRLLRGDSDQQANSLK